MTPRIQALAWLALVGTLGGCGSPQINRIDQNRDVYESWPIDVKQSVLDGKVDPGMTPDMVRVAWGEPTKVVPQGGGDEIWVYERGGSDGSVYYPGYPAGYPGGYPNGAVMGGGPGIGISTGRGGTSIGATGGIGIGAGMGGGGIGVMGPGTMGGPIMTPPTPPDVREVVFRNGVVFRADPPFDSK